ncbi:MAG: VIT family protein [Armatimonadetes bacterium]|nr:VIT family protein [Armatimonadota bacterium]
MGLLHSESHRSHHIGWLRAAVLGANDGVVSVSSLVVGVAASGASKDNLMLTGIAGLVAGALSMAAGEYISVQSQADTENADLNKERRELAESPEHELDELASIYVGRGLDESLAREVAIQLTAHDALSAHARDELGITDTLMARPIQASLSSAAAFAIGAFVPILACALTPIKSISVVTSIATVFTLAALGSVAAIVGGASVWRGALRVTFWGVLAMAITALVGRLFGATV